MNDYLIRGRLAEVDPAVAELIQHEQARQFGKLMMIPSSSAAPHAVLEAVGSVFHNLYAEGYPHPDMRALSEAELLDYDAQLTYFRRYADRRYYKGADYVNILEALAQRRTAEAFCPPGMAVGDLFVNVQPLSGAPANTAIYEALVNEGDVVMGLDLMHGGHLTHGSPVNFSGQLYKVAAYGVDPRSEEIDYDAVASLAREHRPRVIVAGATAYPRRIDFARFAEIAADVEARLFVDMAHIAGLVAAGLHPDPIPLADIVSSTTHKTLRGPRGGLLLCKAEHAAAVDKAVFPRLQGGPLEHVIAGKAVAFLEAQAPSFRAYQAEVIANAQTLAEELAAAGLRIVAGGTDNHLILVDLRPKGVTGKAAEEALDRAGITTNKNAIPFDPQKPMVTSGLRLGTPAVTTRGFGQAEMRRIAGWIGRALDAVEDEATLARIRVEAAEMAADFPVPGIG